MSMYRSYLLKNDFWAKKGNLKSNKEKVFIKHNSSVGGIYAIIQQENRGVKIIADGEEHFFNNFDKLDMFLNKLDQKRNNFMKILKRRDMSKELRRLEL
ncbi:MAG: hypothetical protein P8Y70_16385 [Candidatus Lokiarchaeota archaeon]